MIILLCVGLSSILSTAQQNDLNFLIKKIEVDYPGFKEKTKTISFPKLVHNTILRNGADTFKSMSKIVDFFRDPHLQLIRPKLPIDTLQSTQNLTGVEKYLFSKRTLKRYEGFWLNDYNDCIIAIKMVKDNPLELIGYVVESRDTTILFPGTIMLETGPITERDKQGRFFTKLTSPFSGSQFYVWSQFRNDSILLTGAYGKWKKLKQYNKPIIKSLTTYNNRARANLLDKNTFLITIPENDLQNASILIV